MSERLRPDDSVHDQAVPCLVCADGAARNRAVQAVDGNAERPLQGRDPPGANEPLIRGAPEESGPRLGADDSVDEEAVSLLKGADGRPRLRAEDPIGADAERPLGLCD